MAAEHWILKGFRSLFRSPHALKLYGAIQEGSDLETLGRLSDRAFSLMGARKIRMNEYEKIQDEIAQYALERIAHEAHRKTTIDSLTDYLDEIIHAQFTHNVRVRIKTVEIIQARIAELRGDSGI